MHQKKYEDLKQQESVKLPWEKIGADYILWICVKQLYKWVSLLILKLYIIKCDLTNA